MTDNKIMDSFFDDNGITITDVPEELIDEKPNQEIVYDWEGNVDEA